MVQGGRSRARRPLAPAALREHQLEPLVRKGQAAQRRAQRLARPDGPRGEARAHRDEERVRRLHLPLHVRVSRLRHLLHAKVDDRAEEHLRAAHAAARAPLARPLLLLLERQQAALQSGPARGLRPQLQKVERQVARQEERGRHVAAMLCKGALVEPRARRLRPLSRRAVGCVRRRRRCLSRGQRTQRVEELRAAHVLEVGQPGKAVAVLHHAHHLGG